MKPYFTLAVTAVALATIGSATADLITEHFSGEVYQGPFQGAVGTGTFSYDSSVVFNSGLQFVTPVEGLTLSFTMFGQTFQETDDFKYDRLPVLGFFDGVPSFLDFSVREDAGGNSTDILKPGVFRIFAGGFLIPEADSPWSGEFPVPSSPHGPYVLVDVWVNTGPVPEGSVPAAGLLSGLALVVLWSRRLR